jgi:hypothetical protein
MKTKIVTDLVTQMSIFPANINCLLPPLSEKVARYYSKKFYSGFLDSFRDCLKVYSKIFHRLNKDKTFKQMPKSKSDDYLLALVPVKAGKNVLYKVTGAIRHQA